MQFVTLQVEVDFESQSRLFLRVHAQVQMRVSVLEIHPQRWKCSANLLKQSDHPFEIDLAFKISSDRDGSLNLSACHADLRHLRPS